MRFSLALIFFLVPALAFGKQHSPSSATAKSTQGAALCKTEALPRDVQTHLKEEYSSWKVQEPGDLSANARERWKSEKPLQCPGIAIGHFHDKETTWFAVLLVSLRRTGAGYKFLIFSPKPGQSTYAMSLIEQTGEEGAGNFFIRTVGISKFFDEKSRKKFQAQTDEAILFVDSAENEYEADLYFLARGSFRHEPVDY